MAKSRAGKRITSQGNQDSTPSTGAAPTSGLSVGGQRARGNEVSVNGADAADNSVNGIRSQVPQETATNSKAAFDTAAAQAKLTSEQGAELLRIGMVAPPYTFSGISGVVMFQNAMNFYVDEHYVEAAGYLEKAQSLEPKAADISFYLGICRLLQGHPQDSIGPLKNAAAGNRVYLQPSHYYLAKAYAQSKRFAEAKNEFREAIAVPGRLTADARALLARLQAVRAQIEKP